MVSPPCGANGSSSFSTYFAITSFSMFTVSPMLMAWSVVAPCVWGINDTAKASWAGLTAATVRLTPCTVTLPFSMMYRIMPAPHSIHSQMALSSLLRLRMRPVPSICPDTRCPPSLLCNVRARSRFTWLPTVSAASEVRLTVSGITSAMKESSESCVTVRHTPLVQMLSPTCVPSSTTDAAISSVTLFTPCLMLFTRPISSTMPVNKFANLQPPLSPGASLPPRGREKLH